MDTDQSTTLPVNQITERVIGCAFAVGRVLGPGFLEKVYENALVHERQTFRASCTQQHITGELAPDRTETAGSIESGSGNPQNVRPCGTYEYRVLPRRASKPRP